MIQRREMRRGLVARGRQRGEADAPAKENEKKRMSLERQMRRSKWAR
jgi:hypothetical protein